MLKGPLRRSRLLLPLAALLGAQLRLADPASAHIRLLEPQSRYTDQESGDGGFCPCGVLTGGRRCRQPEERSDANRAEARVTPLLGGSTLRVRLEEYVGHAGRLRVAFDPDGAELDDFNAHVLADIPDTEGRGGNLGEGAIWEIEARLPNIDCERCTLQVIQRIDGDTSTPLLSPSGASGYFACADLQLTRDPGLPEGYPEPRIVTNDPATGGELPAGSAGGSGVDSPVAASAPSAAASSGGCSLGPRWPAPGAGALAVAALALLARRRRPRQR